MIAFRIFVVTAGLLLTALAAPARSAPRDLEPYSVRLDGYVGTKPESAPVEATWTVSLKGEPLKLFVTRLEVLRGNVAYYELIQSLEPYRTALTIAGEDDQLDLFATAPADQKISVIGFMQFSGGARYLMVSQVDYVGAAPTAEPTPTAEGQ